jgi:allantoin racemase
MRTKILWLWDNLAEQFAPDKADQELILGNILEFAQRIARPTTEFVVNHLTQSMGPLTLGTYNYDRAFMAVEVLERVKQAEEDGFDAAFPGMCYGEFFLRDARQAVKMPVVGPAESAMTVAQLIGDKFAVVTVAPPYVQPMEENIRRHGWQDRAIRDRPVRAWTPHVTRLMVDAFNGRPEQMIEEFEEQALPCIEAGADVIICGCNPMGAALSQVGYHEVAGTGVPVVTALPAMIKLAESLVDLRRSVGITKTEAMFGPYRSTPEDALQDIAARGIGRPELRRPGQAAEQAYVPARDRTPVGVPQPAGALDGSPSSPVAAAEPVSSVPPA